MVKKACQGTINALNRYLIPFFGNHHINRIDYPLLKQFEAWRIEKVGKRPKESSNGSRNSALIKVIDDAIEHDFINPMQRLALYSRGKTGDQRPAFNMDKYRKLHPHLRSGAQREIDSK